VALHVNLFTDYWNCTKRFCREVCDYTLQGLVKNLPTAFRVVSSYWVPKAFERSDRYLTLYAMEKEALPFAVREFMIKCWKRHRNVPTSIDQVVDRTLTDLRTLQVGYRKREESNGIKPEKLLKANGLLAALHGSAESCSVHGMSNCEAMQQLKTKMAAVNKSDGAHKVIEVTMAKYHHVLKKGGRLGPTAIAAHDLRMKDKKDLTRMPIMKQTRKRRHDGVPICDPVILEEMQPTVPEGPIVEVLPLILEEIQPTVPEGPIVEVLPQNFAEPELNSSSEVDEEYQPERHMPTKYNEEQNPTEWIMCTSCSKWRILPPDANAATLHVQLACGVGFGWVEEVGWVG
jgi:hypothetical protein